MERQLRIIVPFKFNGAKGRLSSALTPDQRKELSFAMLRDVLSTVREFGRVTILSRPGLKAEDVGRDVDILESDLDLNDALNDLIEMQAELGWPSDILIVMADLALITRDTVKGILDCQGDVVFCPGRGGGTNMILIRNCIFRTCYQGRRPSFLENLEFSRRSGLSAAVYESFRAGCDIDVPEDLVEVLLHGRGEARRLLEGWGLR
ncbi:2-phospho-L-lactate guanylyltransferase [uncultured archaeon]|nr:2-phospho-L-lactate guanylyltransferase [uncultured archaeon]